MPHRHAVRGFEATEMLGYMEREINSMFDSASRELRVHNVWRKLQ